MDMSPYKPYGREKKGLGGTNAVLYVVDAMPVQCSDVERLGGQGNAAHRNCDSMADTTSELQA